MIPGHYSGNLLKKDYAVDFTLNYLKTVEQALGEAKNQDSKQSEKVISTIEAAYPALSGDTSLQIGSKVNTGEMKW